MKENYEKFLDKIYEQSEDHIINSTYNVKYLDTNCKYRILWNLNNGMMWLEIWEDETFENQNENIKNILYKYALDFNIKTIYNVEEANKIIDEYFGTDAVNNYYPECNNMILNTFKEDNNKTKSENEKSLKKVDKTARWKRLLYYVLISYNICLIIKNLI